MVLLLFCSCEEDAIKTDVTPINGIKVGLLFERNGCSVYRFYDAGRPVYFSDCRGSITSEYRSGKTTLQQQTISE